MMPGLGAVVDIMVWCFSSPSRMLCIRSITVIWTGSKYDSLASSKYRAECFVKNAWWVFSSSIVAYNNTLRLCSSPIWGSNPVKNNQVSRTNSRVTVWTWYHYAWQPQFWDLCGRSCSESKSLLPSDGCQSHRLDTMLDGHSTQQWGWHVQAVLVGTLVFEQLCHGHIAEVNRLHNSLPNIAVHRQ